MGKTVGWIAALVLVAAAAFGIWKFVLPALQGGGADGGAEVSAELAQFTALQNENFVIEGGSELNAAALDDLMPSGWAVKNAGTSFDAASGATTINELRFESVDNPAFGVTVDTLKVWGGDVDALKARLAGERLDETLPIAARLDASGIKLTGLESFMEGFMDSYTGAITDALPEDPDMEQALDVSIDSYDVSMGRLIATDVKLRPFVLDLKPAPEAWKNDTPELTFDEDGEPIEMPTVDGSENMDEVFGVLQQVAAYTRTFEAGKIAIYDTAYSLGMTQSGLKQDMSFQMPIVAYSGLRGGDMDLFIARDMTFDLEMVVVEGSALDDEAGQMFETMFSGPMTGKIDLYRISDMRLDKVMRYLAVGEMPPRTETDLMALGRFAMEGVAYNMNGKPFYSIDKFVMDGSEFYWFAPSDLSFEIENLSYNIAGIMEMVSAAEDMPEDAAETMASVMELLGKYDLAAPSIDLAASFKADPESGATTASLRSGLDNYYHDKMTLDITLPEADKVLELVDLEEEAREAAFETLFEEAFVLRGASYRIDDEGGLDNVFGLVVDYGKMDPSGQAAMFGNMEPDQVRSMALSAVGFGVIEAAKEFPPAQGYGDAFVAFLREGGSLEFKLDPPQPVTRELTEQYPDPDPEKIIELLGVSIEHIQP